MSSKGLHPPDTRPAPLATQCPTVLRGDVVCEIQCPMVSAGPPGPAPIGSGLPPLGFQGNNSLTELQDFRNRPLSGGLGRCTWPRGATLGATHCLSGDLCFLGLISETPKKIQVPDPISKVL